MPESAWPSLALAPRMLWLVIERVLEVLAQRIRLVELAGFPSVNGLPDQLVAQLLHFKCELAVLGEFAQLVNAFEHQRPAPMCKRMRVMVHFRVHLSLSNRPNS